MFIYCSARFTSADFSGNLLNCDPCVLRWAHPLQHLADTGIACNTTRYKHSLLLSYPSSPLPSNCSLGIIAYRPVTRYPFADTATLSCDIYGDAPLKIEWHRYRPNAFLGGYDFYKGELVDGENNTMEGRWVNDGVTLT